MALPEEMVRSGIFLSGNAPSDLAFQLSVLKEKSVDRLD